MSRDVRAAAAGALASVFSGNSLNRALPHQLELVEERDRALLQQLCYGTLRSYPRLQALLRPLLQRPLKQKDADLRALLLLGLYQLEETRIPDHAAVDATVEATKALNKQWGKGLVNAILRRFQREREDLLAQLEPAQAAAHPDWLYRALQEQWPGQLEQIISCNNQPPPMTLRSNCLRQSREESLAALGSAGIEAQPGAMSSQAIYLQQALDVSDVPGFDGGNVSVQDEAAQVAAPLLAAEPGERVLDACAAPGGKTCHVLELQPRLAELIAMDIDPVRLGRIQENLSRLGLQAELLEGDASNTPLEAGSFDRILVDAPCSATGVIRRHPDVKLLRRAADIPKLAKTQLHILQGLWPLLKSGGTLLYATCSVLREENSEVIEAFLEARHDANCQPLDVDWGEPCSYGRQLLPTPGGPDGLYYAKLRKTV